MISVPRHYQDKRDLSAMHDLLQAGRMADNGTYYVHMGDINWWLFYPPIGENLFEHLYVWDDPSTPGRLLAWLLLSPDGYIDLVIQPELRGSPLYLSMLDWAEQRLTGILHSLGKDRMRMMWIYQTDSVVGSILGQRGFQVVGADAHMTHSLDSDLQSASRENGWTIRACRGLEEVEARATAQFGAFGSKVPFEQYVSRFRRFMQSGIYDHHWDFVTADESGTISSFCIVWTDPLNRVGLFEPVGTHPDYQRQGLGKAVMSAALQRLQQAGMRQAVVNTSADHTPAIRLYESVGFRVVNQFLIYEKKIAA